MGKKDKKKEKRPARMGWDKDEADEELVADALKRTDMDEGKVKLVDRDSATPVIETYDEDTGALEGSILLKDGNREGLLALVKIIENVEVKQDHDANVESFSFGGNISVENPSKSDRLWDIDVSLDNIKSTNLKSNEISVRELGTEYPESVESRQYQLTREVKNLFLVKEFISSLNEADDILNINDIERELLKLKAKTGKATKKEVQTIPPATADDEEEESDDEEEESDDEEETWEDGGTLVESSLETFGISIDKENTITFAIALRNNFDKPVSDIRVVKTIPDDFTNPIVRNTTEGQAQVEEDKIIWTIDKLRPEYTVLLKFTCNIIVTDIARRRTGTIDVTYQAASSFAEGLAIDKFDAYTRNKFYIDTLERDEEPNIWDNKLIFDNSSEFVIQLFNADVYSPDDENTKYVDIDPNDVPMLPSGAQWHSVKWQYESEDYPTFRKKLEFRVVPDYQYQVTVAVSISDVILEIASITGDMTYNRTETPTYKTQDVIATLKMANNGSAPLNEVTVLQKTFTDEYQPPKADEIQLIWDGDEVEISSDAVSFEMDEFKISLKNLKDNSTGMVKPDSTLEFKYPIHCVNPARDSTFESEITYLANTYPVSQELDFTPEVPIIEALHIRRKFRIGKEVLPIGDLGNYRIILTLENIGESKLHGLTLLDKVPDSFEYGDYSEKPKITDEVGQDTLKWVIDEIEVGDKLEISYEIKGSGKYSPSDAQLAL
ncbi:MAG: hypothetical protein NWF08_00365 [Candidatus Bathyarchaeota archaeon]|jgi:hypothetical protein|nr:hypothetical protein [Candidatus Bathyarchaeota archaeon]